MKKRESQIIYIEHCESDPEVAKYMFWTSHNDINKTISWVKKEISKIDAYDWF